MSHSARPTPTLPFVAPIETDVAIDGLDVTITLDARAAEGLRARQVNVKESFTLTDSQSNFFRASLVELTAAGARALVYEAMATSPESTVSIELYCAVLQRQRMLWVCQKATELGVSRIVPVFTERSVQATGLDHEKWHAWPGQILKGARQCRRATLPALSRPQHLQDALASAEWSSAHARFVMDDRRPTTALRSLLSARSQCRVALVVGPEGGFDARERLALDAAGALSLKLGGRVLRSETAVISGLTALQLYLGDMSLD